MLTLPKLPGHYRFVPHYPDFPYALYADVAWVSRAHDTLIEVGSFLGHGTCYMMECLQHFASPARFYAIDPWGQQLEPQYGETRDGLMPWGEPISEWERRMGTSGASFDAFQFYTDQSPARSFLHDYVQFPPASSSEEFDDVSFVHLAYSQTPAGVARDMAAWWPKVRAGGRMAVTTTLEAAEKIREFQSERGLLAAKEADRTWVLTKPLIG